MPLNKETRNYENGHQLIENQETNNSLYPDGALVPHALRTF